MVHSYTQKENEKLQQVKEIVEQRYNPQFVVFLVGIDNNVMDVDTKLAVAPNVSHLVKIVRGAFVTTCRVKMDTERYYREGYVEATLSTLSLVEIIERLEKNKIALKYEKEHDRFILQSKKKGQRDILGDFLKAIEENNVY